MNPSREPFLKRLPALFEIPAPDAGRALRRILFMERDVMLLVKVVFIGIVLQSFNYSHSLWMGQISSTLDVTVDTVQYIFWFYIAASAVLALPLFFPQRLPLALLQWTTVTSCLVDALLLAAITVVTGGLDSILFWLFIGLVLRNSVSVPPGFTQLFLNFATSLCYVLVAALDATIAANTDDTTRRAMVDLQAHEDLGEPFVLRMLVLWLTAISSYGAQAFLERQRLAEEEAREFGTREGQLRSAGRLAAEFAHQIKNPLTVINNAAYSLQRSLTENKNAAAPQIEIIREEVARVDRVITQIMGYAQLSEGRVEKLDIIEEIERAMAQVFPQALPSGIILQKNWTGPFPPVLMQRGHLAEILVNLLLNAREALGDAGKILVAVSSRRDHALEISVRDNGPGIAPDRLERIFEAYFTTKEKGTGLGLAIVKHNAELYSGIVRVESELGKGAKFTVVFPEKASPKPFNP